MTSPHSDIPPQSADDLPHKPADDTEEIYYQGSPMLRGESGRVFAFGIAGLIFILLPFLIRFARGGFPIWYITIFLIGIGLIVWMIPVVITKSYRYRISNYRIDSERGILSKTIDTLELWHVEDISFHQSLMDRFMNVGTITVLSHDDTTPKLELKSIPNARTLFDQLKQRIIAVKRQRGVVKMDIGA